MSGPLDGVRVVDLTRALAGPYATLMLADAGADVLKVERPGSGDDTRGWGPPFAEPDGGGGDRVSTYFLSVNRNKRSIELNLKDEDDLARLQELITDADVLVENFRPGVMDRLGLGEQSLADLNPRLVSLAITGFGQGGPQGHRPGFDQILQGEGGLMSFTGPVDGPPTKVGVPIADILAGMFGAYGVVASLYERERTGRGQRVYSSLLGGMVAIHTFQGTRWLVAGHVPETGGNRHPSIQPYGAFRCADGRVNVAVGSEGLWRRFAPLVDLDPEDERFVTNGDRVARVDELEALIEQAFSSGGVEDWLQQLDDAGVPAGRIAGLDDVYRSPQVAHLGLIDEVDHPTLGHIQLPGSPLSYSGSASATSLPPPLLGEHNDEGWATQDV
ncbi:CoA transferase [soil metagenome]